MAGSTGTPVRPVAARVVNPPTSSKPPCLRTQNVASRALGAGFSSAGALGGFLGTYSKTPIGQAVIAGINKGIYELVKQIGAAPASGSVIKAEGNRVWINVGADVVSSGEMLKVMHKGEELIDPETGISLGASEMEIGQLRVAEVADKFSIADRVAGSKAINRGDKVVSTAAAVSMEYASDWNPPKRFF